METNDQSTLCEILKELIKKREKSLFSVTVLQCECVSHVPQCSRGSQMTTFTHESVLFF